jgi:hypothetical protein
MGIKQDRQNKAKAKVIDRPKAIALACKGGRRNIFKAFGMALSK